MIYRKDSALSFKRVFAKWLNVGLLVVVLCEAVFLLAEIHGNFWEMKFVDVANVVAQFATAGAFFLGFHQYRRAKRQERQSVWSSECKIIISKMIEVLKALEVGERTSLSNLKGCVGKLGNLAIDFEEGFSSLDEGDQKAALRMHWQDMYFNNFSEVMRSLAIGPLLGEDVRDDAGYLQALAAAYQKVKAVGCHDVYREYNIYIEVLSDRRLDVKRPLIDKLEMHFFVMFFFESDYVNDYMYGNMARIYMRVRAPLLAAIYEVQA
jgi:hypothetical protein